MTVRTRIRRVAHEEAGFSLIEMLAALAILLTVMGTLVTLMVSATKSEVDLTQRVRAQQETRLALERIRHEIHRACSASHLPFGTVVAGAHSNVRLIPPTDAGCLSTPDPSTALTWCMSGTDGPPARWTLWRIVGTPADCSGTSGARAEADYITTQNVFTLDQPSGSLATLKVNFPVDLDPTDSRRAYRLEDSLVLRNSTRAP